MNVSNYGISLNNTSMYLYQIQLSQQNDIKCKFNKKRRLFTWDLNDRKSNFCESIKKNCVLTNFCKVSTKLCYQSSEILRMSQKNFLTSIFKKRWDIFSSFVPFSQYLNFIASFNFLEESYLVILCNWHWKMQLAVRLLPT